MQLAAIYFGTPEDDRERSLTYYEKNPEDTAKEEIDCHLNKALVQDTVANEQYVRCCYMSHLFMSLSVVVVTCLMLLCIFSRLCSMLDFCVVLGCPL